MLRVTLVSRVTARSLQNNVVGYVPPSGDRSCNKCVNLNHCLSCYKFVDTQVYTTPDSGLTYTAVNATPCSSHVMYHISTSVYY